MIDLLKLTGMDARSEAEDYIQWHIDQLSKLKNATEKIPDEDKPTVLVAAYPDADEKTLFTFAKIDTLTSMIELAGGRSISSRSAVFYEVLLSN